MMEFQDIQFLRPQLLWLFLVVPVLALGLWRYARRKNAWQLTVAPHLRNHLIVTAGKKRGGGPRVVATAIVALTILALAGPTWMRSDDRANDAHGALVIALDLSRSMLADDIQPTRLERAKLKVKDLLDAQPGAEVALIAYAGTAHTVVPLTRDYRTINEYLDALSPVVMPVRGTNLAEAMMLTDSILAGLKGQSTVVVLTDNLKSSDFSYVTSITDDHVINVMAIGTPNGGNIMWQGRRLVDNQGVLVRAPMDIYTLQRADKVPGLNVVPVTLDNTDVQILARHIRNSLEYEISDHEDAESEWRDMGYFLLPLILTLGLLFFRRGWTLFYLLPAMIFLQACNPDLWRDPNKRAMELLESGEPAEAATIFEDEQWKAVAQFESGNYQDAISMFGRSATAVAFHNQGLALAHVGQLDHAADAFQLAAEIDPDLTSARENLQKTRDRMHMLGMITTSDLEDTTTGSENNDAEKKFEEYTEVPGEKDRAQDTEQELEGQGDVTEMAQVEVREDLLSTPQEDAQLAEAREALLRQVDVNPALFLARKFLYQVRDRQIVETDEKW